MTTIDVNSDLGEAVAGATVSDDAAILDVVSSANVASGFHAGTPRVMAQTVAAAVERGVTVGVHPSYRDMAGFGRRFMDYEPTELADEILYQIGALDAIARAQGTAVKYVKPHGALYHAAASHPAHAQAVVDAVKAFSRDLPLLLLPGSLAIAAAEKAGIRVVTEAFADRAYQPDGKLVSRTQPNALVTDLDEVRERVLKMAVERRVTACDGTDIAVDAESICVHGDSPGAVAMSRAVREALEANGVTIASFA